MNTLYNLNFLVWPLTPSDKLRRDFRSQGFRRGGGRKFIFLCVSHKEPLPWWRSHPIPEAKILKQTSYSTFLGAELGSRSKNTAWACLWAHQICYFNIYCYQAQKFCQAREWPYQKNKVGHHHSILSLLCVLEQYLAQKYGVDYRLFKNLNISFFI